MASLRKEGKYWKVYFYHKGKLIKRSTRTTSKRKAEQIRDKIVDDVLNERFHLTPYTSAPLSRFFEEALAYSKTNKAERTWKLEQAVCKKFLEETGDIDTHNITFRVIERYKTNMKERGLSASYINNHLRTLSGIFALAVQFRYCSENPFKAVKLLKLPQRHPRFLTRQQAAHLLENTTGNLHTAILIALNTGARLSEVLNLTPGDVDFKVRRVRLIGKGDKERHVPLTGGLEAHLRALQSRERYVTYASINNLSSYFRKKADACGLHDFRFHDLRHTYASWLAQAGVSLRVIQKLLGHESIRTTEIYAHLALSSIDIAGPVIDNMLSPK